MTKAGPLSYTIPKNQLKMDKDLNVRHKNIKFPEKKKQQGIKSLMLVLVMVFWI